MSILRFLVPAPAVMSLGGAINFSLPMVIEMICAINFVFATIIISTASSQHSITVASLTISPAIQCINAAWLLLGLPLVIMAGVGAVLRVENHLKYYLYYLIVSMVVCIVWFLTFAKWGSVCKHYHQGNFGSQATASFVCAVTDSMVLFWLFCLLSTVLCAIYLVWSMIEYVNQRNETELHKYQDPWRMVSQLSEDSFGEANRKAETLQRSMQMGGMPFAAGLTPVPSNIGMPDQMYPNTGY